MLLLACYIGPEEFRRSPSVAGVELPGPTPPPAEGSGQERLYQLLFVGEHGGPASAMGQRARMLAWFDAVGLSDPQAAQLAALAAQVRAAATAEEEARAEAARREAEALGPIYLELVGRLAQPGSLPDAAFSDYAKRLGEARASLGDDPRAASYARVRTLLTAIRTFTDHLRPEQKATLAQCRFFLGKRMGPLSSPGDNSLLVGTNWDGGDFSSLRSTERAAGEEQMDLGGLWSTEALRASPGEYATAGQLDAILLLALLEPGFAEALEVRRGQRPIGG
jgi:hypothetical protein